MFKVIVVAAVALWLALSNHAGAQTIKLTIGQTGINPGTGPFIIAQKENLFAKHGLEVKVIETTTTSAVQAILGGSMQLTMGAGPAFTTATLEGAPPFINIASWINVFPYYLVARKEITKIPELKGKTGQVGVLVAVASKRSMATPPVPSSCAAIMWSTSAGRRRITTKPSATIVSTKPAAPNRKLVIALRSSECLHAQGFLRSQLLDHRLRHIETMNG